MKFKKGQEVICKADYKDWSPIINDAIIQTDILIGNIKLPVKNNLYIVENPLELFFNSKTYIKIEGFEMIFDEKAFIRNFKKEELMNTFEIEHN